MGTHKKSPLRIVMDTNVLVSAMLFAGLPSKLVYMWQKREIILLLSKEILAEYIHTLSYPKFSLSEKTIKAIIEIELLPFIEAIIVHNHVALVLEDTDDNKFIECAIDGQANYIISGNSHLLKIKRVDEIKIITVKTFLNTACQSKSSLDDLTGQVKGSSFSQNG